MLALTVGLVVALACGPRVAGAAVAPTAATPAAGQVAAATTGLTGADLCAAVAHDAGFRADPLVIAVAVALHESTCNPLAKGVNGPTSGCPYGSTDRGLWQINSCYSPDVSDACAYDAACNARTAYRMSAGGTSWRPWASYTSDRYLAYIDEARVAVARLLPLKELFAFGPAPDLGSTAASPLFAPLVGMAGTPTGHGYWLVAADGGIFAYGDARFFGSTGGNRLNRAVVGMAATPTGHGYWLVAADGGIFAYGDARFFGSTGGIRLNRAVVGMAATPTGHGYWLVAADGGIFAYGDARFSGSTGGIRLNQPIAAMEAASAGGYRLVASDGGIFTFGGASFLGSLSGLALESPIVAAAGSLTGRGYRIVAADGGVFSFGDAAFLGRPDLASLRAGRAVGIATQPVHGGYWVAASR